jgi:hypothetical protein
MKRYFVLFFALILVNSVNYAVEIKGSIKLSSRDKKVGYDL